MTLRQELDSALRAARGGRLSEDALKRRVAEIAAKYCASYVREARLHRLEDRECKDLAQNPPEVV